MYGFSQSINEYKEGKLDLCISIAFSFSNIKDEDPDEIKSIVKKYKEKLKNFRNCGLEKDGEMSLENLVFKLLRRNGYIEKLYDIPTDIIDKKLSMKQ